MSGTAFITYTHDDSEFRRKLVTNLDSSELDINFDGRLLKTGNDLTTLFEEIDEADILIPILSKKAANSGWVKEELRVGILDQIEDETTIKPVIHENEDFDEVMGELPDGIEKVLRVRHITDFSEGDFHENFAELVGDFGDISPPKNSFEDYLESDDNNPFTRIRTESFESNEKIAEIFAKPIGSDYSDVLDLHPTIIEGGRGSGKTMILKSLQARISVLLSDKDSFEESNKKQFGVYCKMTRGSFTSQSRKVTEHVNTETARIVFTDEIILNFLLSTVEELKFCCEEDLLELQDHNIRTIINETCSVIGLGCDSDQLNDFINVIRDELKSIDSYVKRRTMGEDQTYGGPLLNYTALGEISKIIVDELPGETNSIYYLVDEYEALKDFQKIVINTLVKRFEQNKYSFNIAGKKSCFNVSQTLEGEELEEYHDYNSIDLDYDISDQQERSKYKKLLIDISKNLLKSEGYPPKEIDELLETRNKYGKFSTDEIDEKIKEIRSIDDSEWEDKTEDEISTLRDHYGQAAWYRLLGKHARRQFGGLSDFALLSSGITRFYLRLVGFSFYEALQDDGEVIEENGISVENQTAAAYTVSRDFLDYIHDNISQHGRKIHYLVLDLGDIFKKKLFHHSSEPEAGRIGIEDPEHLSEEIIVILDSAEEHSIIQRRSGVGGMRPRSISDRQPREYTLNRIFAPTLGISPRYRWRTSFTVQNLTNLIDEEKRESAKEDLMESVSMGGTDEAQSQVFDF
jgi:hypothetical protein